MKKEWVFFDGEIIKWLPLLWVKRKGILFSFLSPKYTGTAAKIPDNPASKASIQHDSFISFTAFVSVLNITLSSRNKPQPRLFFGLGFVVKF